VLDGLVELGRLTPEARAAVTFETPKRLARPVRRENDQTIYLEQMVRAELARNGRDFAEISRGGYKIYTTFDRGLIEEAKKAVHGREVGTGPRSEWPKRTEIGLVSLDPRTGAVRAVYGGNGKRAYSAATQDAPQAGSIYKPFTLLAALEGESKNGTDGISLKSRFSGRSPYRYDVANVVSGSNKVTNFDGEQFGKIDLITATEHSVNTVYAQLNEKLDVGERTRSAAMRAGLLPDQIGGEVSNTLGNGTPHVVDMASAYGTIAARGWHRPYFVIDKIVSPRNGIVYRHDTSKDAQVFSKDVTADATHAMRQVIEGSGGTGSFARNLGRPAAGKTGTVGGNGRETLAAWFVGFTPQLSTAVAIHRLDPKGGADVVKGWGRFEGRDMQGGMFPVRIWTDFMRRALEDEKVIDLPEPAWVGVPVDPAPERVEQPQEDPSFGSGDRGGDRRPDRRPGRGDQGDGAGNAGQTNQPQPSDPGFQGNPDAPSIPSTSGDPVARDPGGGRGPGGGGDPGGQGQGQGAGVGAGRLGFGRFRS
jgi:membrane peptidoglycan carboxypeptidase